jgi:hypothetical protein
VKILILLPGLLFLAVEPFLRFLWIIWRQKNPSAKETFHNEKEEFLLEEGPVPRLRDHYNVEGTTKHFPL